MNRKQREPPVAIRTSTELENGEYLRMASKGTPKDFDCVKWTCEVGDQFYEETKYMTREELRERLSQRPTNPVLARPFDRRKAPQGRNAPDEAVGE